MTIKQSTYIMVQVITVLTALNMLTNAQTTCNQGLGRVVYERLPDHQLQNYDDDTVQDSTPPFRVLEKCQELCLRDRTATNNLVRTCITFDFQPGSRIASFNGIVEYEQSTCYLTREQAQPEGIGTLVLVPNSVHYAEVCLSSSRIERECPDRHYIFERHPRKKLKLPVTDIKELIAANRTDCEDRCLNEFTFVCRSATYDMTTHTCWLSRFTRRSHPELMEDDPMSDYLENTCLNAERRCEGAIVFVKEENKRLGGPFEADIFANISLQECQAQCLRAEKYFCRAVEYDDRIKQCIIFEEDSMSQRDDLRVSGSPTHDLYDLVCLDTVKGNDFPENAALFSPESRKPDTAFQRYRNSRLGGDFLPDINGRSLGECLDECLRQVNYQCHSVIYSERLRICRMSKYNQRDGHRVIYDADFDYYENLVNSPTPPPFQRTELGPDAAFGGHSRPPYAPLAKPPTGAGFSNAFGGGTYPGYSGSPSQQSRPPYTHAREMPGHGYWNHLGSHSTDVSPYNAAHATSGAYPIASITPIPPAGYPGAGSSPAYTGSSPPLGASSLGYPQLAPGVASYPPPLAGGYYPVGFEPPRPFNVKCEEGDGFKQIGVHLKMRKQFVRKSLVVPSLTACERECADSRDFLCRSFNYRAVPYGPQRENCELTDRDTRDLDANNPNYFENAGEYDFYERAATGRSGQDCLDVSQTCSEDGMEFTLKTPEGFLGRIYTHGYYDRCFYRGNGGTVNVLRISGAQGYPDCGTIRAGDMMSNIVVVQFSDFVQTSRDRRYNLTCLFRSPGEAVVTSSYMTANAGSPVPIEYLPAENSLTSRVRLMIMYQGRPTNTIAIGDPLTFRIEAQDGYNYINDIFASNVIARDPYSGRAVQLIDRYGCPVDNGVFPALDRSREGDGLEARFNAFKLPESNFLVFEATVRTCREGCTPSYCTGPAGRTESLGRRKRDADEEESDAEYSTGLQTNDNSTNEEERLREMIKIYESRSEMPEAQVGPIETGLQTAQSIEQTEVPDVCLTKHEYFGLLFIFFVFTGLIMIMAMVAGTYYRKYWKAMSKTQMNAKPSPISNPWTSVRSETTGRSQGSSVQSLFSFLSLYAQPQAASSDRAVDETAAEDRVPDIADVEEGRETFKDSSEPIYICPSLFEMPNDELS